MHIILLYNLDYIGMGISIDIPIFTYEVSDLR
jgi:hypothetical protein